MKKHNKKPYKKKFVKPAQKKSVPVVNTSKAPVNVKNSKIFEVIHKIKEIRKQIQNGKVLEKNNPNPGDFLNEILDIVKNQTLPDFWLPVGHKQNTDQIITNIETCVLIELKSRTHLLKPYAKESPRNQLGYMGVLLDTLCYVLTDTYHPDAAPAFLVAGLDSKINLEKFKKEVQETIHFTKQTIILLIQEDTMLNLKLIH